MFLFFKKVAFNKACHPWTLYLSKIGSVFLEISQKSQENTCARVSFLINRSEACNFIKKETLAQVFSCEFCDISKNTFFYRTPLVTASFTKLQNCSLQVNLW